MQRIWQCMLTAWLCATLAYTASCTRPHQPSGEARRIISLAPSITESLYALGLGDRVVGVTTYCRYPPATTSVEKVGGYTDANLEQLLALRPDLVILQQEHEKHRSFLTRYGVAVLSVDYRSVRGICSSFAAIGRACGATRAADSLMALFDSQLCASPRPSAAPSVLLCVGRDNPGGGTVQSLFAAGAATFYNDLIEAAGGRNAFADSQPQYPRLSQEGIITLAPDIIVDISASMGSVSCSTLSTDWSGLAMVPAVLNGRIHCLGADYATIPGPRVLLLLDDLRAVIGAAQ